MRILRASDYRRMPWKNGGGETTEILVSPAGSGLDDFDWRVSMARVDVSGPFSVFPGTDRTLSILAGEGLTLDVDGSPSFALTRDSEPFSFAADVPTAATLIGGPVTDLNVMTRRGRATHTVTRLRIEGPVEISTGATVSLLLCTAGSISLETADVEQKLDLLDGAALGPASAVIRIVPVATAELFRIDVQALSPTTVAL